MVFVKKGRDQYLKIPSEYCMVDGVPDTIRSNPQKMRTLLGSVRTNPEKKMKDIGHMVNRLFEAGAKNLEQWGIEIDAEPIDMKSRKLAVPQLIHNSGSDELFCSERLLKQMPVYNSRSLEKMTIVFMYDGNQHHNDIEKIWNELRKCQDQLGMNAK